MKNLKLVFFAMCALFLLGNLATAQNGVVIYNDVDFQGANITLNGSWSGGGAFDRNISSIRVPAGYRVRIFTEKNYRGTEALLTEDWNPGKGAYWINKIRSIRIDRAQILPPPTTPQPPTPPSSGSFPVIYAQADYKGPAQAIERDFAGNRDWNGSPHRIRSIRVPAGWYLVLYDKANFRGKSYNLDADWTPQPGDYWFGKIRSIKVYQGRPPKQPK